MAEARPKRRVWRWLGIGALTVVLVVAIAGTALWIWKPWAPEIVVAEPEPGGEWVRDDGMVAHWYPAQADTPGPALLVVGGSEGGLNPIIIEQATALQQEGYSVLVKAYFGAEGLPDALENIPLENFHAGLDWMAGQEEVDPDRIGMFGGSKGAEAALLVAGQRPDVAAVVANVPSHVVWQGLDQQQPWRMGTDPQSSWSQDGEPLPYVPTSFEGGFDELTDIYQGAIDQGVPPETHIDIATIDAPVLITCGDLDTIWPSCVMAEEIAQAAEPDGPDVTVLDYPDGGHFVQGPPMDIDPEADESGGGTAEANTAAREDAWPQVLDHLDQALGLSR